MAEKHFKLQIFIVYEDWMLPLNATYNIFLKRFIFVDDLCSTVVYIVYIKSCVCSYPRMIYNITAPLQKPRGRI